jgi:hypothetical protein
MKTIFNKIKIYMNKPVTIAELDTPIGKEMPKTDIVSEVAKELGRAGSLEVYEISQASRLLQYVVGIQPISTPISQVFFLIPSESLGGVRIVHKATEAISFPYSEDLPADSAYVKAVLRGLRTISDVRTDETLVGDLKGLFNLIDRAACAIEHSSKRDKGNVAVMNINDYFQLTGVTGDTDIDLAEVAQLKGLKVMVSKHQESGSILVGYCNWDNQVDAAVVISPYKADSNVVRIGMVSNGPSYHPMTGEKTELSDPKKYYTTLTIGLG